MAFIDQGEFEAIQTLSGRRAPRCDKHHFHAKMMVITLKWYFYYHTLLHLAAFHMAFGQLHESC